jgi:hypothetical protein
MHSYCKDVLKYDADGGNSDLHLVDSLIAKPFSFDFQEGLCEHPANVSRDAAVPLHGNGVEIDEKCSAILSFEFVEHDGWFNRG